MLIIPTDFGWTDTHLGEAEGGHVNIQGLCRDFEKGTLILHIRESGGSTMLYVDFFAWWSLLILDWLLHLSLFPPKKAL